MFIYQEHCVCKKKEKSCLKNEGRFYLDKYYLSEPSIKSAIYHYLWQRKLSWEGFICNKMFQQMIDWWSLLFCTKLQYLSNYYSGWLYSLKEKEQSINEMFLLAIFLINGSLILVELERG